MFGLFQAVQRGDVMTKTKYSRCLSTLFFVLFCLLLSNPAESVDKSEKAISLGQEKQTGLSVTVYNSGLGLIRDRREFKAGTGRMKLEFSGVPSQIIPSSVSVRPLGDSPDFTVLEQNYEYDLLSPQELLDKYVGKEVKLYYKNPYTEREETTTATLLSNNGGPVFRIGSEITFGHPGRIIFPGLPEDSFPRPTLLWTIENKTASLQGIEASYLTNGMTWQADYVLTIDDEGSFADLSSWVTIDNKSGASYKDASLALVAGEVGRVRTGQVYGGRMLEAAKATAPQSFREEGLFEYHLYTLQRRTSVMDKQAKQISFVSSEHIGIEKEFVLQGAGDYYFARQPEQTSNKPVSVVLTMENKKEYNLGMPLPAGTVRIYEHDHSGNLLFLGEDNINHTPEGEKIKLKAGEAFDIAAGRTQTDWKKVASDTIEESFDIKLRNHGKENVAVRVIEPIPGDWTILSSSSPYRKTSASSAEFLLTVPAGKETDLTYSVRIRH
jgi:hypothetical protein